MQLKLLAETIGGYCKTNNKHSKHNNPVIDQLDGFVNSIKNNKILIKSRALIFDVEFIGWIKLYCFVTINW